MEIGYVLFLMSAVATHALVGYTLGTVFFDRPMAGTLGGVAADLDFLFPATLGWPFVHRGITHSAMILGIAVAAALAVNRTVGGAVGVAYLSHLLIDSTTPEGVPFLYPLIGQSFYAGLPTTGHSPLPTVLLWLICIAALYRTDTRGLVSSIIDGGE